MANGVARMAGKIWNHPANDGQRTKQLAQAVRFQVRGRVLKRSTTVPIGAKSRMIARLDSSATILAAYANPPDYAEWQVWRRFLRPGDLFVDVGANVGTYTLLAIDHGADVIAVEPDPHNVERLKENLDLNGYSAEIWELALAEESGIVSFTDDMDSENHIATGTSGREVPTARFDSLVAGRSARGMKIDVEGAERRVLEGAAEALSEGRVDLLQVEWNDCARRYFGEDRRMVRDLLAGHGYELFRPDAHGHLHLSDGDEGADVFAARPGVVDAAS